MSDKPINPIRNAIRTFLIFMSLFVVYALAVQATDIDIARLRIEARQEQLAGVLRFLADPNLTDPDLVDITLGDETGPIQATDTSRDTLRLILETVFMALMATTIGTVLAVPVSFLAARNLMIEITMPLAAITVGLIALPVGWVIGSGGVGQLVALAENLGESTFTGLIVLIIVTVLAWAASRSGPPLVTAQERPLSTTITAFVPKFIAFALALFGLALLSILGRTAGLWMQDNFGIFSFLGVFTEVLFDLVHLLIAPFIGFIFAMIAASIGSRLGQETVLRLSVMPARMMTAVFAFGGSAVLIYGIGSILNWLYQFDYPENWTTRPALIGGVVIALLALILPPKQPFSIGSVIYTITRSILNILRSIEPLIMGVVFVIWVGLGPFAGVMALTLHTIAALGKLFSEQIEGIDDGPIEAINATGANRMQMIVFAVIPQITPLYIAYTLYRWDINVRVSTIIGFVGGGGIGFLLSQSVRLLRYRDASVMMLSIAIVVCLLDYVSSEVRKRII